MKRKLNDEINLAKKNKINNIDIEKYFKIDNTINNMISNEENPSDVIISISMLFTQFDKLFKTFELPIITFSQLLSCVNDANILNSELLKLCKLKVIKLFKIEIDKYGIVLIENYINYV